MVPHEWRNKNVANHPQAKKRNRQRIKITARNRNIRSTMRSSIKQVRTLVDEGDKTKAGEALIVARKQLDRAVTKGVVYRRTASRLISRLTLAVSKITAS